MEHGVPDPDMIGRKFGEWTVIRKATLDEAKGNCRSDYQRSWLARCSCGKEKIQLEGNLIKGLTHRCRSCAVKKYWAERKESTDDYDIMDRVIDGDKCTMPFDQCVAIQLRGWQENKRHELVFKTGPKQCAHCVKGRDRLSIYYDQHTKQTRDTGRQPYHLLDIIHAKAYIPA